MSVLLLVALAFAVRAAWWPLYKSVAFEEIRSGSLSNDWPFRLYEHSFSSSPRFLLVVEKPDGVTIELQARRVRISRQYDGTDAIQYLSGDLSWESDVLEWKRFARSPGLWNHDRP